MKHVFDLMDTIRERPYMYLGGDSRSDPLDLLRRLELLLYGYGLAVRIHGAAEPVPNFVRGFSDWLNTGYAWDVSCGPIAAIEKHTKSSDEAWERFWSLLNEYRQYLGA